MSSNLEKNSSSIYSAIPIEIRFNGQAKTFNTLKEAMRYLTERPDLEDLEIKYEVERHNANVERWLKK